jgi:hypothetical protein
MNILGGEHYSSYLSVSVNWEGQYIVPELFKSAIPEKLLD